MDQPHLIALLSRLFALQHRVAVQVQRSARFIEGLALASLSVEGRQQLTNALYARQQASYQPERGLFDWETRWFAEALPSGKLHVLIGGAGCGREAAWFLERGDRVTAFDPVPGFVEQVRARWGDTPSLAMFHGGYDQLVAGDGALYPALSRRGPFDAILLGWGSFSHVADPRHRVAVLRQLRTLCPAGPLLVSLSTRGDQGASKQGRVSQLGQQLGRLLGPGARVDEGDWIVATMGYFYAFSHDELAALARDAGYRVNAQHGAISGHPQTATLIPLALTQAS